MKRYLAMCLCFCLLAALCGCGTQMYYVPQTGINLNYNNISAGGAVWFDNDGIYYPSYDRLVLNIRSIDSSGKHRLTTADNTTSLQKHDDCLYWVDYALQPGVQKLMKYDLTAGKKTKVVEFTCDDVFECYLVGEYIYAMTSTIDKYSHRYNAVMISVQTGDVVDIAKDIFACGVHGDCFYYLVTSGSMMQVYSYDRNKRTSIPLGSFEPELSISEYCYEWVNFTSDSVLFYSIADEESRIHRYDYLQDIYIFQPVSGFIYSLVAYDEYAFMLVNDQWDEENEDMLSSLYHIELDLLSMERIDEGLRAYDDLFVTSDQDLYLFDSDEDKFYHYTGDGTKEEVTFRRK